MAKTTIGAALISLLAASAAQAQAPPPRPPSVPRARGPDLDLSIEAARAAVAACLANGFRVVATVVDSAGVPVVVLSGNGAPERAQAPVLRKAYLSATLKIDSTEAFNRAQSDPAFAAQVAADPKMLALRGALLMRAGPDILGALSVGGATGPDASTAGGRDEDCAKVGVEKVASRLR